MKSSDFTERLCLALDGPVTAVFREDLVDNLRVLKIPYRIREVKIVGTAKKVLEFLILPKDVEKATEILQACLPSERVSKPDPQASLF